MLLKNTIAQAQKELPTRFSTMGLMVTLTKDIFFGSVHQNFFVLYYKDNEG